MSIYSAKLYAKSIPAYTGSMESLVNSNTYIPAVPELNNGKVKNIRSLSIKNLIKYLGADNSNYLLYSKSGEVGSRSDNIIELLGSRYSYRSLLFIYGKDSSYGSIVKTNSELNLLLNLNPSELRLIELSYGVIGIYPHDNSYGIFNDNPNDLDLHTKINFGINAENIEAIYGVGAALNQGLKVTITYDSNFSFDTNYLLKENVLNYIRTDESRNYINLK